MDTQAWIDEAECLLRSEGLWPDQNDSHARGMLELAAQCGLECLASTVRALRCELRDANQRQHAA